MKSSLTLELEKYTAFLESQAKLREDDCWRLGYHVMPPTGWLNDPNGLCRFNGEYHLFFQYSPSDPSGALKYWGHYVSKDMISWEYKGIALYPDMPYDCNGVYSGSAIAEGDECRIYYTGNVKLAGDYDYIRNGREGNTVSVVMDRDGHFSDKHLLLKNDDYPANLTCHVRDPKVWKENGIYYMVLGARTKEDKGCVLLYASDDQECWSLKNVLETKDTFGFMWECPDMFVLGKERFLSVSPQGLETKGLDFANIYQSGYMTLSGDFTGEYTLGTFYEYDRGFDFYAPQTFEDEDGRRILIGWMGMPDCDYVNLTEEKGWQHCMTVPRVLTEKGDRIYQNPILELERLRGECMLLQANEGKTAEAALCSDIEINFTSGDSDFRVCLDGGLYISYNHLDKIFSIEFEADSAISGGRTYRGVALDTLKNARILLDTSSAEIFINDGAEVFSTRIYPQENAKCHTLEFLIGKETVKVWKMEAVK